MEERLAEEIRKYPVLYDKGNVFFKDMNKENLAWSDVASAMRFPSITPVSEVGSSLKSFAIFFQSAGVP